MNDIASFFAGMADLPAMILIVLLLAMGWMCLQAQRRSDFDFARMLRDDNGKESALNLGILGSFAISSWTIMHEAFKGSLDSQLFWAYCMTWSGARVFIVAAQKWDGRLPWAKGA
jgi:hypothetical protein